MPCLKNHNQIAVGLSGGVDSAVCALLLKQQGWNVFGIFMQNWETDNQDPYCHAERDLSDARTVCDQLNIPFHVINFSKEYWENVFQYCLNEFSQGYTPNPDIWCNKEIKFKIFLDYALKLGADYLATGHYAKIQLKENYMYLLKGTDVNKDQSYFLYTLGQRELNHCLFPLGHLCKTEVRQIAERAKLVNCYKKDSTGICFVGERNFKKFLSEFLLAQPGLIQTTTGKTLGQHDGLMFYTIGQRKGLHIGGKKDAKEEPWYVVEKNLKNNILIVDQGHNHPWLYSSHLECTQLHWVSGEAPITPLPCQVKIRYRQTDVPACLIQLGADRYLVQFESAQRAITPGQAVVFYQQEVCLGGGTISYIPKALS